MRKQEIFLHLAVAISALAVYLFTLAPSITWRNEGADSGDLVTASFTLGVPHPTGYPLYTLIAAIFSHLPFTEPAHNVSILSALAASAAIFFLAHAGRTLLGDDVPFVPWIPPSIVLTFAFAPVFWSQATIPEVNSLAAFFAAALLAVLLSNSPRRHYYSALIFGLGLAHHLTILLLLPAALILLTRENQSPSNKKNFSTTSVSSMVKIALLVFAPLAFYLYLPLRAAAHPPINWGDAETWDGFFWVVSGAPYHQYVFAAPLSGIFVRIGLIARFLFEQFTVVGVAFGLWGAVQMAGNAEQRRIFIALLVAFGMVCGYAVIYSSSDSFVYLTPAFFVFALWIMWGIQDFAKRASFPLPLRMKAVVRVGIVLGILLVLMPLYNLAVNFGRMNLAQDNSAYEYARKLLTSIPSDAIVIADGDEHLFALEYFRYVITPEKKQIIVSAELLQYSWYFDNINRTLPNLDMTMTDQLDRVTNVIDASLAQHRGVYTTVGNEWFQHYALEHVDDYYRVLGKMP